MVVNPDYNGNPTICNYRQTRKRSARYENLLKERPLPRHAAKPETYSSRHASEARSLDCFTPELLAYNFVHYGQEIPDNLKTTKLLKLIEKELVKIHKEALAEDKERSKAA